MKKKYAALFLTLAALLAASACAFVTNAVNPPSEETVAPEATTAPEENVATEAGSATSVPEVTDVPGEASAVCMSRLQTMLDNEGANIPDNAPEADQEYTLVTYQVSGDKISSPIYNNDIPEEFVSYQKDTARHQELWKFFTDLIPADQRTKIGEFLIFSDGVDGTIGAVDEASNPDLWTLEIDIVDAQDLATLSTTLVHEFAHMLTLSDSQLDLNASTCPVYESIDGCSKKDSYINAFYDQFWADIYDEWSSTVIVNDAVDEDQVTAFYDKYPDQFVSDYAPTGPEEDIAETWIYFVFGEKPAGDTIAEEKILFFYNYPELVSLRQQILNGMCPYTEQ